MVRFPKIYPVFIWIIALLLTGFVTSALAQSFHSGGVGNCNGCHSMHSAQPGNQQLLLSSDPSSICLNCHAGLGGPNSPSVFSPDGSALTPGGDFYWLTKSFSWLGGESPGDDHGHNIVALDYNLFADVYLTHSPGGSFPATQLGCTSCHDPHGRIAGGTSQGQQPVSKSGSYGEVADIGAINGNYRLLGDASYRPKGGPAFQNGAPIAHQSSINKFQESDSSHVDYGFGMSEWCGNCHADLVGSEHRSETGTFRHPSGSDEQMDNEQMDMYNTYVKTGDFSGSPATAYLQFVPFERGTTDILSLDPNSTQGPNSNSTVMCLTCHRAHASAFSNIGRWDFTAGLLVESHPAVGDMGATINDVYYSYYGRDIATEFGSTQGQFCQKCHGASIPD